MSLPTFWVCVAQHPTVTTTRLDLADRLARPLDACPSCHRPWDRDLEPSTSGVCPDCEHDRRRETTP